MPISVGENIIANDFINESQIPTPQSDAEGKVVKLEDDGKISSDFIRTNEFYNKNYIVAENMNGTTTPVAVFVGTDERVFVAEATSSGTDTFIGFCVDNITNAETAYVNGSQGGAGSALSFTANAGVDRVVVVHIGLRSSSGTPTNPSSVTYGGNAMTLIAQTSRTNVASSTWVIPIGTNASNDSAVNIIQTGAVYANENIIQAMCYQRVNQTTPVGQSLASNGNSTTPNATLNPQSKVSLIINTVNVNTGPSFTSWNNSQTNRLTNAMVGRVGDIRNRTSLSVNYNATISAAVNWTFQSIELLSKQSTYADIQVLGRIGFSGLTPNSKYYLSGTAGAISTIKGSDLGLTTVLLGKASSINELLIIQD